MIPTLLILSQYAPPAVPGIIFSEQEVKQITASWNEPARYTAVDANPDAPFQVIQSGDGAKWMYTYYKKRSPGVRILPTQNPAPTNATHASWDKWISATYESDFKRLQAIADSYNDIENGYFGPPMPEPDRELNVPPALSQLVGTPPVFAEVSRIKNHRVNFNNYGVTLRDAPEVRHGYPYLRFSNGVMHKGTNVLSSSMRALASQAGIDEPMIKILESVSALEGGFDSINTYDTGYVSVGFIQFACLENGSGSLGRLLRAYKAKNPAAFKSDFHNFGIEVSLSGYLVVVDPKTGKEFIGHDAAMKIIEDKRLTAVFMRAGQVSQPYRVEQLRMAKQLFDPRPRQLTALIDGKNQSFSVGQLFKSEAGLATIMDRLINTGSITEVGYIVTSVATDYKAKSLDDLVKLEDVLTQRLSYRTDFLTRGGLTQPVSTSSLVASTSRPTPTISGRLEDGNQPLSVVPGFNVSLNPIGEGTPKNPGKSPAGAIGSKTESTEKTDPPTKPDQNIGRPITDIGG